MKWNKLISELKRRNVFKSTIAYLAIAWIIIQIASILFPAFEAPDHVMKALIYILSFGLVIWVAVSWVYELTPEGIQKTEDIDSSETDVKFENRKLNKFIVTSLVVAVVLLLAISFWAGSQWEDNGEGEVKKVAVLPLNYSQDDIESDYFNAGMTDLLIGELSKVDQLTVVNNTSTQVLAAGLSTSTSLVLNVVKGIDYYVEGVVNRELDQVSTIIELKESIDKIPVWKKSYSKDLSEIRLLWAEVANDITAEMGVEVSLEDQVLWSNLKRVRPETFELYLKGKHSINKFTPVDMQRGMVYLQQALDKNPADPYAWAYLAETYINIGHGLNPPNDVFPKALAAAERAIQLDSTLAEGWAVLSHYHTYFGMDWDMAEYAFERANRLNPNLAANHYHRAWYLALFGKMNEAIAEHKRAQELDPFAPLNTAWLGELYRWVGLFEEGIEEADKAAEMEDNYALSKLVKGRIFLDQGRTDEGLEILRQAAEINPDIRYFGYGTGLLKSGHLEEGKEILKELENLPLNGYFSLCLGMMHAELKNYDKAFEYWNSGHRHAWYPWLRVMFVDPELKKDPRYLKLIRDMNLPDPSPLVYNPD